MTTTRVGRPPIGPGYEFARPADMAQETREVARWLGITEAEATRRAIEIGLVRLQRQARWVERVANGTEAKA